MTTGGQAERTGHDQLFKQVLHAFFADFVRLFDPESAAQLDLETVVFRDAEAFTVIPQGQRRTADLVAAVQTRAGDPELILMHVEVQRERQPDFPFRMWQYYSLLRQRENLPVLPIAVVLYPEQEGVAQARYDEVVLGRMTQTFYYLQISLPSLEAREYASRENVLGAGLSAAMKRSRQREERMALYLAARRRVDAAHQTGEVDEARAFLLTNLIMTYLPLSMEEWEAVRVQLRQEGNTTMEATELTWAEQIEQQGMQQGVQQGVVEGSLRGLRAAARRVVNARFGRVTPEIEAALAAMTREDDLSAFIDRAVVAASEVDLLP